MKRTSIFEGLNVKIVEPPVPSGGTSPGSIFEGLNAIPLESRPSAGSQPLAGSRPSARPQAEPDPRGNASADFWGKRVARTGKSLVAGAVGGLADMATSVYNIPAALNNATSDLNTGSPGKDNPFEIDPASGMPVPKTAQERPPLPLIPSAMDAIDEGIDHATGDYTRTPEQEKWFQEGVKFAASVASPGGLASLAGKAGRKGMETVLKAVGSTKPSVIAGAGATGAVMEKAQESGASTPLAFGSGIGAGLGVEAVLRLANPKNPQNIVNRLSRAGSSLTGFGRSNLNLPAIESANRLNIDLPGVAATKGVAPAFAHQMAGKLPYFGDKLKEKIRTASQQYQKAWDGMLDSVGVSRTEEVSKNIDRSYDLMRSAIPEGASVIPAPILEAIASVEGKLKTAVYSDPAKKLFSICQEFKKALIPSQPPLPEGFDKLPRHIQEKILVALGNEVNPISVKDLVRQKVELNKIMKDRNIFDRHDTDSLAFVHEIRDGIAKTLESYGATNPTFMKTLKRADEKFARTARREALDDVLAGKIVDPKTGDVSYSSLLTVLNDRKRQKFLKNNLGQANYKKLEDFVNVAKAMESVKRNNPNPSGSATVYGVLGLIQGLVFGANPIPALATIGGASAATKLLTSKQFLNKATQFAREPTEPLAQKLEAIVNENTGMTVQTLQKAMRDNNQESYTG